MRSADEKLSCKDGEHAERDAQQNIAESNSGAAVLQKIARLICESGKGRETAAHADLEQQDKLWTERSVFCGERSDEPDYERAENIDKKRFEGKTALRLHGQKSDEVAADGADGTAESDDETILHKEIPLH